MASVSENYRHVIYELFLCRFCQFLVHPYYTHCKNGHALCNFCILREDECPDCLVAFSNNVVDSFGEFNFPCYYARFGCTLEPSANLWHSHVYDSYARVRVKGLHLHVLILKIWRNILLCWLRVVM